jgi:hypothetical protein
MKRMSDRLDAIQQQIAPAPATDAKPMEGNASTKRKGH